MSLPARVLRTIRKHDLFRRGARVLVAVSGGSDSVALLHVLRALEDLRELTVTGLAHLNHQLRGPEADADERFCRDLAAGLGLPIDIGRVDVAERASSSGLSLEAAARSARYAFLREAASRGQADVIAVGHTLDDQAETFLLRLLRGAGARGLGGIRPRAGNVVRPLLEIGRAELRAYAGEHRLEFREDLSNADVSIPRNRIRHDLLPHLERYSPAIRPILARQAAIARADEEYLARTATELSRTIVSTHGGGVELDVAALRSLPPALASRVARAALEANAPGRFVACRHIEDLLALGCARDGASVVLPAQTATRVGNRIVMGAEPDAPFSNPARFPLSIPGEASLAGWTVTAERLDLLAEVKTPAARAAAAFVAAPPLRPPLAVRTRRPGDRFRPLGMGGRGRKLQDFLVDRKVVRRERDSLPLVVDRDDRIVWVVGLGVAEDFRVTEPQQGVILLKARRLGGLG